MGNSHPAWQGYDHQLLSDKKPQSFFLDDPARSQKDGKYTSSNIVRNNLAKGIKAGEWGGFLDDPYNKADDAKQDAKEDIVGMGFKMDTKGKLCTGWKLWQTSAKQYAKNQCFGTRLFKPDEKEFDADDRGDYVFDNYQEVYDKTVNIGLTMRHGFKDKFDVDIPEYSTIGIFARNRAEWLEVHLGNWSQSYRTVALYDTLGFEQVKYIVGHAELPVIFTEKDKLPTLWKAVEANNEEKEFDLKLKIVVQFDYQKKWGNIHENIDNNDIEKAKSLGLTLIKFTDLINRELISKDLKLDDSTQPLPRDLAYVMYTSGTTGVPKGVKLSHRAFASVVASSLRTLELTPAMRTVDWIHVSYLPLAHSLETSIITVILSKGGKVGFYNGNIKKIAQDWKDIKPSIMLGVPRIYNKTYDRVVAKLDAASGLKGALVKQARAKSFAAVRYGRRSPLYDTLIWSKIPPQLGYDNVKFLASGAAPLSPAVAEFLRVALKGCVVVQGYGLTETTAISFFTALDDLALGHVGVPIDNIEYRLIDVPDKEYFVEPRTEEEKKGLEDGTWFRRGEIQMRGPSVMDGYFKNEEATKKTLFEDGWLSTGDIGRINPNGTLSIIDRAKAMFKLERGEYISPEKVEIEYQKCPAVAQIFVTGNSNLESPVALIVPDGQWLQDQFAKRKGEKIDGVALDSNWSAEDDKLTLASEEWVNRMNEISAKNKQWIRNAVWAEIVAMKDFFKKELRFEERIVDIDVEPQLDQLLQGFTVANGTLTPSFKLKRRILEKKYEAELTAMYDRMNAKKKNKGQKQEEKKSDVAVSTQAQGDALANNDANASSAVAVANDDDNNGNDAPAANDNANANANANADANGNADANANANANADGGNDENAAAASADA